MAVFKLVVSYRGTDFCGWQRQKGRKRTSLQETLEAALSRILCEETAIIASGRTDAGVHSLGQVAAFRTEVRRSVLNIQQGMNGLLPESVRVLSAQEMPGDFHPQFQAKRKAYRYLVQNVSPANPLVSPYAYFFPEKLDLERMRQAAACLVGRHDFAAFQDGGRRAEDTVRSVYRLTVGGMNEKLFQTTGLVGITIVGDGFLYKMVRNIVGTLLEIGRGKIKPERMKEIRDSGDRRKAGPTAPAHGLTLLWVRY